VREQIHQVDPELEQGVLVVATDDDAAAEKLRDWALERSAGFTAVPISPSLLQPGRAAVRPMTLEGLLAEWLIDRDPYRQLLPVTGESFFGRRNFLEMLTEKVQSGEHVGIFGLRKIGKTSVLLELARRLSTTNDVVPVVIDLQASAAAASAAHAAFSLGSTLASVAAERSGVAENRIKTAMRLPSHWGDKPAGHLISDVTDALGNLLDRGALSDMKLAIFLDEIELLLGENGRGPMDHALAFLRGMRALSQRTRRLSLVIAGVNATPCEQALLAGVDNPLYSFVEVRYLGAMERAAGREMVRGAGARVGVKWTDAVLDTLLDIVGRHPLLTRLAASHVVSSQQARPYRPSREEVRKALTAFHRDEAPILREIIQSLDRFYPEELELFTLIALGEGEAVAEWQREYPEALNHLEGYGVVDIDQMRVAIPVLERFLLEQGGRLVG
jgi:hypothetical protein